MLVLFVRGPLWCLHNNVRNLTICQCIGQHTKISLLSYRILQAQLCSCGTLQCTCYQVCQWKLLTYQSKFFMIMHYPFFFNTEVMHANLHCMYICQNIYICYVNVKCWVLNCTFLSCIYNWSLSHTQLFSSDFHSMIFKVIEQVLLFFLYREP